MPPPAFYLTVANVASLSLLNVFWTLAAAKRVAAALSSSDPQEVNAFVDNVHVTSTAINGPTKDLSPWGSHGHPGLQTIGGTNHFYLYANQTSRMVTGL